MINPSNKEIQTPNLIGGFTAKEVEEAFKVGEPQPDPIPNQSKPIVDSVIEELLKRKQLGIERRGTPPQTNNRDTLKDAFEDALDSALSIYQAIVERDQNK